jgi:hypothetical protein
VGYLQHAGGEVGTGQRASWRGWLWRRVAGHDKPCPAKPCNHHGSWKQHLLEVEAEGTELGWRLMLEAGLKRLSPLAPCALPPPPPPPPPSPPLQ